MRRFLVTLALLFLAALPLRAQTGFTNVTAIVQDPNGAIYANCRGDVVFVPAPSSTLKPLLYGSVFQTDFPYAQCDSFGRLSLTLADNNQITDGHTSPPASQWRFNVSSQDGKTNFTCTLTITGLSMDITLSLQACAAVLPSGGGGGGGGVGPCATLNSVAKFTGLKTVGCSNILENGVNPAWDPLGYDVGVTGAYDFGVPNNTSTGTVLNKFICDDGSGNGIVCPAASSTTDRPTGTAVVSAYGAPGKSGNTGACVLGYCLLIMDNVATAKHFAQVSASIDGAGTDVGATAPSNGLPYYFIFQGNTVPGTAAVIRILTPADLNAAGFAQVPGLPNLSVQYNNNQTFAGTSVPVTNGDYDVLYRVLSNAPVAPGPIQIGLGGRAITGATTTATVAFTDNATVVNHDQAGSQNVAVTLPTATTLGNANFAFVYANHSANSDSITPSGGWTIQKDALAASSLLTVDSGSSCRIKVDPNSANNWLADCHVMATFIAPGIAPGSITSTWLNGIGASYTFVDTDNTWRYRWQTGSAVLSLPQPNTITQSPFVSTTPAFSSSVGGQSSGTFTSGTFSVTAGNQFYFAIIQGGGPLATITQARLSTGDICGQIGHSADTQVSNDEFYCPSISSSTASATATVTYSGTFGSLSGVAGWHLIGTTHDNTLSLSQNGGVTLSLTNPVHFANALAIAGGRTNLVSPTPPFIEIDTFGNGNIGTVSYRFLANQSASAVTMAGNNTALFQSLLSMSAHPAFVAGWYVVVENVTASNQTVNTVSSLFSDGTSTMTLFPNQWCAYMSNGVGWDHICGEILASPAQSSAATSAATNFGATLGAQTIVPATGAGSLLNNGVVHVNLSLVQSTLGVSCGAGTNTVTPTLAWTGPGNTAETLAMTALSISANGTLDSFQNDSVDIAAKAGTAITYTTASVLASAGCSPTPQYTVYAKGIQ